MTEARYLEVFLEPVPFDLFIHRLFPRLLIKALPPPSMAECMSSGSGSALGLDESRGVVP